MINTKCTVCGKDSKMSRNYSAKEAGMYCGECDKFYCPEHRKRYEAQRDNAGDAKTIIDTCHKGHEIPKKEKCGTCSKVLWVYGADEMLGVYCKVCNAYYCNDHHKATGWERVAAGVDAAIRRVTCGKGHTFMQSES